MREKLLLIDGHSILNRAFYGLPTLTNSEGLHTNAVYGFLNILFKILEEEKPQYITVAFDLHVPTFRHEIYGAYKGTRKPMPEELQEQVPLLKQVLDAMGVKRVELPGFEADDILGTLARRGEGEGYQVTLVSGDRDLLQLATDTILVRIPKTRMGKTTIEDYHTAQVVEKYQVTPRQIIDLKALMGDSSDNISGIPGVGEKTATKIIREYGSIENAYDHVGEIKPKKAMESLRDHYDMAQLSKTLATIRTDIPLEWRYEDARLGSLYTREAYEIFRRLDFKNYLTRFNGRGTEEKRGISVRILKDLPETEAVCRKAAGSAEAGIYVLVGQEGLAGLALSLSDQDTFYLPVGGFLTEYALKTWAGKLVKEIPRVSTFDLKTLYKNIHGEHIPEEMLSPEGGRKEIFDVQIAAYLLNPLKTAYTYDAIASEYMAEVLPAGEEIFGKSKLPPVSAMEPEKAAAYAGHIAYVALKARKILERDLKESQMDALFHQVELPLAYTLADMEEAGIEVEKDTLVEYGQRLQLGIREVEEKIYQQAGERFNLNSPRQLGEILFGKLQLPGGKKTKTGYSTAAEVLEKLADQAPIVADILEYRQLAKLKSTYADGLMTCIAQDGRIHSTFHQTITATGRISSTEPNLQNIPVRMELGRQIRKAFVASEGCVFLDADYSQIELRVLAHMSGDEKLIQAYREAQDIHRITASQVFHVPFEEVTPLQRRNAKAVNFGIIYGISSFGLSQDLSISRREAADYIQRYFQTYPKIKAFLDSMVEEAREKGYACTLFGRRRPMPELKSGNFMTRSFGERVAMNAPIQGTAADIIKIAMVRVNEGLRREGYKARLLLQVHDELLVECPLEEVEAVSSLLQEEMQKAAELAVALEVDMHTGANWYEAK